MFGHDREKRGDVDVYLRAIVAVVATLRMYVPRDPVNQENDPIGKAMSVQRVSPNRSNDTPKSKDCNDKAVLDLSM